MDRIKKTADIIIDINKYRRSEIEDYQLVSSVCEYFDLIKDEKLTQQDLHFLKNISNIIGIPHFYDLLEKFKHKLEINKHDLATLSSIIYESTLHTSLDNKVHKYQKNIINLFDPNSLNRFFLSSSTSFGKTHIAFEIISKMNYKNVVLIFPTIALLSENLEKIISDKRYSFFKEKYAVHTLSEVEDFKENNLFIYTPERFLSFIEKNEFKIEFDFAFIDEVYKIDNDYIIDEEVKENERDVAYRLAVFYALKKNVDVLLAGPYIDFSKPEDSDYNNSFDKFLAQNGIKLIDYNNYEIVNKTIHEIKTKKHFDVDDKLAFDFESTQKKERLIDIVAGINKINENAIIYSSSRTGVETTAKNIIESGVFANHDSLVYEPFLNHISNSFDKNWVLIKALRHGVGIHHGLVPKYIQKEIIQLFNQGLLKILVSTTTITEGVNTSAKNLIVLQSKKGTKELKKFDAKNIAGRAGRFLFHYSGRVIVLQNNFMDAINATPEGLKHKNYDVNSPKDEIDLFYSGNEFLSVEDREKIIDIKKEQSQRNIPDSIFNQYKVVSRLDKIKVYDSIQNLSDGNFDDIKKLIMSTNSKMNIDYDGFQAILNVLEPIVKNKNVKFLIDHKTGEGRYSILTHLVYYYLRDGFIGSMNHKVKNGKTIDGAIRETADFVYNTLKYQVVKYLGVFNIMYKFSLSQKTQKNIDDVIGIDKLLMKLEYNALSDEGRIASDYGVPSNIVEYYENKSRSTEIREKFDNYETEVFEKISKIINKDK